MQLAQLGEGRREVVAVAAGQAHGPLDDGRDHTHAVPFHLEGPLVLVADILAAPESGEHRRDRLAHLSGVGGSGIGGGGALDVAFGVLHRRRLVLHQVEQPVRLRLLLSGGGLP